MSYLYWSLSSFYLVRRTWSCQWPHCGGIWDWHGHTCQVSRHQLLEHHRGPRPPAPPLSGPWALHTKTQGSEGFTSGPESDPRPRPPSLLPRILAKWVPDGLWPSAAWDDLHGVWQFAGHPETQHHQETHPAEAPRLPAVECCWQGGHPIRVGESPEFGRSGVIQLCCWTFTSGGRGAAGLEATSSWWVCEKLSKFHTWWEYESLVMMCLVYVFTTYCKVYTKMHIWNVLVENKYWYLNHFKMGYFFWINVHQKPQGTCEWWTLDADWIFYLSICNRFQVQEKHDKSFIVTD